MNPIDEDNPNMKKNILSSFTFDNLNQLPKDAIPVQCSRSLFYVFRIGSEIFAVDSETYEVFFCKKYLRNTVQSLIQLSADMGECLDTYCYYYYAKGVNSLDEFSIPSYFDNIQKTSSENTFYQASSTRYYLIYLARYDVHAIDLQTGYHYNCRDYVDIQNYEDYESCPFHSDMRECYGVGVKVYQIPDRSDSRRMKEWMNAQAEVWMGNKFGTTKDDYPIPDSAIEYICLSGRRYAIYDSVEIGIATDLSSRESYYFEDMYDSEWKKNNGDIFLDLVECIPIVNQFGYDYSKPE